MKQIDPKLYGIAINGIRVSATAADQNGLVAVVIDYMADPDNFQPTAFKFANGAEYVITKENFPEFKQIWSEFRKSFFKAEG